MKNLPAIGAPNTVDTPISMKTHPKDKGSLLTPTISLVISGIITIKHDSLNPNTTAYITKPK